MENSPTADQHKSFKTRKFGSNQPILHSHLLFPSIQELQSASLPSTQQVLQVTEKKDETKITLPLYPSLNEDSPPISPIRTKMGKLWINNAHIELSSLMIIDMGSNLLNLQGNITCKRLKTKEFSRIYFSVPDIKPLRHCDGKVYVLIKLSIAYNCIGLFVAYVNHEKDKDYYFSLLKHNREGDVIREMTFEELDQNISNTGMSLDVTHFSMQIIGTIATLS